MQNTETPGIDAAIAEVGGQESLAKIIGCTQQNISAWKSQGFVPVEHIIAVEQASGVPRARLIKPQILELITPPSL